ncbi:MAG: hypothetical protein WCF07_12905, partial [Nitrososphaeraceae archaeon]
MTDERRTHLVFDMHGSVFRSAFILFLFLVVTGALMYPKSANADGLFEEQLSASFHDRKTDLIIKMMLPVVTTETLENQSQKPVIQFKLYDPAT